MPLLPFLLTAGLAAAYTPLSDSSLRKSSLFTSDTSSTFSTSSSSLDSLLAPILVPRVPGTPGHAAVQSHFISFFQQKLHKDWILEWHNSTSLTPATGKTQVPFSNLILRRDPPRTKSRPGDVSRLTLAAHYDSLYRPEGFIGAVDSAVPCALLLHTLESIDAALTKKWETTGDAGDGLEDEEKGVQVVLFDGEEAWVQWTDEDSLYGSRALADHWEKKYPPGSGTTHSTPLEAISLFLLLDLLGAADPTVQSFFEATHWAYQNMATVEARLRSAGLLETTPKKPFLFDSKKNAFNHGGYIQDDHVPFLQKGVNEILHIIPSPFPKVWHTMDDNGENLDGKTVRDWGRILNGFVAEWMDLEGFLELGEEKQKGSETSAAARRMVVPGFCFVQSLLSMRSMVGRGESGGGNGECSSVFM
ncbi:putative glutaminyl-peptide cyclotransferase [Podospora australis]|uniref:Peptide hydrolase n=1 Tax=Podospora australis TaxID=1536484 RepID=A0AAN6X0L2_9PEZI|nr:putative glutaminyl-peptide cyclotransferase [Podospora australis]